MNNNSIILLNINGNNYSITTHTAGILAILHGDRYTALRDPGNKKYALYYLNKLSVKITGLELAEYIKTDENFNILIDTIINYYDNVYTEETQTSAL